MPAHKILFLDDDHDTCELIRIIFEMENFRLDYSHSVDDALSKARTTRYDAYLTDSTLHGGGKSGMDFCREMLGLYPHARVIFYTGETREEEKQKAFGAGAVAYLTKPSDFPAMIEAVRDVINTSPA